MAIDHVRDPAAIYAKSFAIIRAEADLGRFDPLEERVVVRIVHACGLVETAGHVVFSPGAAVAAEAALKAGAPILCDSEMVARGVTRARLPADNEVVCALNDPRAASLAVELGLTRSAAAMDLLAPRFAGAVFAIGNAPTALFRILELVDAGAAQPAAIVGVPVGFVGAAESKDALMARADLASICVAGRRGGSAMAAAAINALASARE